MRWLLAAAVLAVGGCKLDRAQFEASQEFASAASVFAKAASVFGAGYGELAGQKHTIQEQQIESVWKQFLARHTNADGQLVSKNDKGEIVPMPVEQLQMAVELRDAAMADLRTSKNSTAAFGAKFLAAAAQFEATAKLFKSTHASAQEQKESVAEMLNTALTALVAAGVGAAM